MTDTKKPTTTVAQDVEALRAVLDGQHAQTESAAEVLAEIAERYSGNAHLMQYHARLSRSLAAGKVAGVVRLWDSQWVSIVNHDNCYHGWTTVDAVAHAIKMTERLIREDVQENACPPADPAKAATTCWQHRPGSPCPTPASCRANGCSAVEREIFPGDPAKASGSAPDGCYVVRYNDDGEFGQHVGWLYRTGGDPCVISGKPVYVWRPLAELLEKAA